MTEINLLPWRERAREERKRNFLIIMSVCLVLCAILLGPIYLVIDHMVQNQKARNTYLLQHISRLDEKIAEIKSLKRQREQLLARMNVIQQLQANRTMIVHIYDDMVKIIPSGVYVEDVEKKGAQFSVTGISDSNQGISKLMRNIGKSQWLTQPVLMQIQTKQVNGVRESHFRLRMFQRVLNSVKKEDDF